MRDRDIIPSVRSLLGQPSSDQQRRRRATGQPAYRPTASTRRPAIFKYVKLTKQQSTKYKYKLHGNYLYDLSECFEGFRAHTTTAPEGETPYAFVVDRRLTIRDGYTWNGANVIRDREWNMRASCVHDALCQLLNKNEATWKSTDTRKNKADYRRCADREWFCIVHADKDSHTAKRTYSALRGIRQGVVSRRGGWFPFRLLPEGPDI